ncbi:NADP-dependent oxidoreductase [Sediminispirochaeta smaragdinae]|uniref:Alcohol dehydrogenase zinc-binding domain protein n=1 Tax=Sediminispirochaeta smaragdinae (strain DSM 11293 / JCM 15392 / SEBR 4228) TaxID=573413 RepID=E1R249_SEDSS|nr:NADP-dependent oxidoreductase [Sediminispirochaeta smaragdinae]ADK81934.1 Alcohol dehydrogenase zinc-binding domain protein [Sediminispirochaeta smaragdinae DSM 11293]
MKAVRFSEFGGPEVLQLVEADEPHAGAGQVRIAVHAAGINPADWKIRAGYLKEHMPIPFPSGTGFEASGVVDEIGEGVTGISVGDAVFGFGINTVAQYAVLTSWSRKPKELSFEEAAGYPTAVETATRVLGSVNLKSGDTILVDGAAGGVGTAMIQLARHRGFHVIGTSSEPKHEYLRSFGALPTTYGSGLADRVKKLAPNGVNAAFDFAGAGSIPELVDIVGDPSRVVTIADMAAVQKYGVLGAFTGNQKNPELVFQEAATLHSAGAFRMPIDEVFPFERIADAHRKSESGRVKGKLVVKIS